VQALEKAHSEGSLLHALTLTLYVGYVAIVAVVQLIKLLLYLASRVYAFVCGCQCCVALCTRFSGGRIVAAAVGSGFDGLSAAADGGGGGATAADGDSSTQPRAPHIAITVRDFAAAGADSAAHEALAAGGGGGGGSSGSSGIEHYGCAGDVASSPARGRGSERAPVVTRLRGDSHGGTASAVDAVCGSPAAKRLQRLSASRPPLPHSMATPGGPFARASGSLRTAAVLQGALAAGSAVQRRGGGSPPAAPELSNEPLTPTPQLHSSPGAAGAAATPVAQSPNSTQPRAPHIAIAVRDVAAAGAGSAAHEALAAGGGGGGGGSGSSGMEHCGCAGDVASSPARGRGSERAPVVVLQGALAAGSAVQRRGGGSPPAAAELSNEPPTPTPQLHSSPGAAGAAATPVAQSPNSNVGDAPGTGGSGSSGGGREAHEKAE